MKRAVPPWLRGLGLVLPGDVPVGPDGLHVAMLSTHARSPHLLGLWLVVPARGADAQLGLVTRTREELLAAIRLEGAPLYPTATDARRATTTLPAPVAEVLVLTLREVDLATLADRPIVGSDGFSSTIVLRDAEGPVRVLESWHPRGRHLDLVSVLGTLASRCLGAGWNLPALRAVREELEAADGERRAPPPSGQRAHGPIVVRRSESGGARAWTVSVGEDERASVEREGRTFEATLPSGTHTRWAYAIDPARVRALGARVGHGALRLELEIDGRALALACPEGQAEPTWQGLPPAVRADVARADALGRALEAREDDDGEALDRWLAELPDLPPPIRTEGLLARFRMDDGRTEVAGGRWFSLFETGVLQRFDACALHVRGRPVGPVGVPDELMGPVLVALEASRSVTSADLARALAYDDDDRNVTLAIQTPVEGVLVERIFSWSYGPMAPALEPAERAALDRVYALYQALMKVRQLADVT